MSLPPSDRFPRWSRSSGVHLFHPTPAWTIQLLHPKWSSRHGDLYVIANTVLRLLWRCPLNPELYARGLQYGGGVVVLGFGVAVIWTDPASIPLDTSPPV